MRTTIVNDPFAEEIAGAEWHRDGIWPARWVKPPTRVSLQNAAAGAASRGSANRVIPVVPESGPFVAAYRLLIDLETATDVRLHIAADERYGFYLDGELQGRGSERGDANHWFFETYDLSLTSGVHMLVVQVWALGDQAAFAQHSLSPGLLVAAQAADARPSFNTGEAPWQVKVLGGYSFVDSNPAWGTGANLVIDGASFSWGFQHGEGDGWQDTQPGELAVTALRNDRPPSHLLLPAALLPQLSRPFTNLVVKHCATVEGYETGGIPIVEAVNETAQAAEWQAMLSGGAAVTVPPRSSWRVLIDLENYVCAYPAVTCSAGTGAIVRVNWQEALYNEADAISKGMRDAIEGKYFTSISTKRSGVGDTFVLEGGSNRTYETLWWQCGRFIEIYVETADEPAVVEGLKLTETRYPLEMTGTFTSSNAALSEVIPIMLRGLQMCSHETYMDCPFYEQLMYVGDTRLEALTTYVLTADTRLPHKALEMFDASRMQSGLTQSRYPSRVLQTIPPFSLWWVAMLYDYWYWRDDAKTVAQMLSGARGVVDCFLCGLDERGLVTAPAGWNYMDWVPAWRSGVPPEGDRGVSAVINWQLVLILGMLAEMEGRLGEPELALRNERLANDLANSLNTHFWVPERKLYADNLDHTLFSEHAQCLAILSHRLNPQQLTDTVEGLLSSTEIERTTVYFTHYLFEAFTLTGHTDKLLERMKLWFDLKAQGFVTTVEEPEPSRSDCHGWGAHPLYHYYASLLGIRPGSPGFQTVDISPQPGSLTRIGGELPHPRGMIVAEFALENGRWTGYVRLPQSTSGTLKLNGEVLPLQPGINSVR